MDVLFSRIEHYCFQGHTHIPGVFTRERFIGVEACDYRCPLGEEKLMINVGSVGQPREGDARACYVILKENEIVFRRVDYPVTTTVEKILAIPELDRSFADRLLMGQ